MTRRRRAISGALSTVLQVLVLLGSQLLISPIVLKSAGNQTLGQYAVVTQFVSYLVLLDLGFGQALQRFMARANGLGDQDQMNVLFSSARIWMLGINMLQFAVVVGAIVYLRLWGDHASAGSTMTTALAILAVWFLVRGGMVGFVPALTALQYISSVNYLTMIGTVIRLGLSIALLSAGFGLNALVLGIVTSEFLLHFGSQILYSRKFGRYPIVFSRFSWEAVKPVAIFGLKSLPIGLAATSTLHSDSLLSAYLFGAAATSVLFTTKLPALHGTMLINRFIFSATPALYELHAQQQAGKLRDAFLTLHRYNFSLSLFFAFGLILYHAPFIAWWVGAGQYGGESMTQLFSVYVIVMTTSNVNTQFAVAKGEIVSFSVISIVQTGAVLVLSLLFGWQFGVFGVVLGAVASQAAVTGAYLWWVTLREFGGNLLNFALAVFLRPLLGFGVPTAIVLELKQMVGLTGFIASASVYVVLSVAGFLVFVTSSAERDMLRKRLVFMSKRISQR